MIYPRDMKGYGQSVPEAKWSGKARIAVQFVVLNYEVGAERSVLHGDDGSETFLSDIIGAQAFSDRHMSMESLYEYGSRVGAWHILKEFKRRNLPLTVFGVAMALPRNADVVTAFREQGHEIACHGLRWLSYQSVSEAEERSHLLEAVKIHTGLTGSHPCGWYTGRDSPQTRQLVVEEGSFEYDSDCYGDDLPFWVEMKTAEARPKGHLVIPYTLDTNDMRFTTAQGFNTGSHFLEHLSEGCVRCLVCRGRGQTRNVMSIGLHCRLVGRPGRFRGLQRFLDHIEKHDRVWVTRCIDIASHWTEHPFKPGIQT